MLVDGGSLNAESAVVDGRDIKNLEVNFIKSEKKNIYSRAIFTSTILISMAIFLSARVTNTYDKSKDINLRNESSVYVPGGGFSGFWFLLGRLNSISNPERQNYYCYSAGCLAVSSTLLNVSFHDVATAAIEAKEKWKRGDISQYLIVEDFVEAIIPNDEQHSFETGFLDKINIITTNKGFGPSIRRAESIIELKELLILTTWIPYVTGRGLWKSDRHGKFHMDGGVSAFNHPNCNKKIGIPYSFEIFVDTLNPNISYQKAKKIFNAGLSYLDLDK